MRQVLSTEAIGEDDRLDYWNQVASIVFWPLRVGMPKGSHYVASVTHEISGALELSTVTGFQHEVRHTGSHAASTADDKVALGLLVSGLAGVAQDGRACTLQPGEATLFDPSRPYSMRSPADFSLAVFSLPSTLVRSVCGASQQLTARPLQPLTGVTAAALSYLSCVAELSRRMGVNDLALSNGSLPMVGALLRGLWGDQSGLGSPDATHDKALAFIDLNLHEPSLAPADVASACHVSLRQLYRVFERAGQSVAGAIRDRRLARARAVLETMTPGTPVAWVGSQVGFTSPEQFTRASRAAHGMPPGAWRASQHAGPVHPLDVRPA